MKNETANLIYFSEVYRCGRRERDRQMCLKKSLCSDKAKPTGATIHMYAETLWVIQQRENIK